mmetsp:Transcript_51267/g.136832  ORF Transcript_51267/g.136832 Transcript_51267/m.136832 type:complete len:273 (-) Transcript_51267:765-1583(-)
MLRGTKLKFPPETCRPFFVAGVAFAPLPCCVGLGDLVAFATLARGEGQRADIWPGLGVSGVTFRGADTCFGDVLQRVSAFGVGETARPGDVALGGDAALCGDVALGGDVALDVARLGDAARGLLWDGSGQSLRVGLGQRGLALPVPEPAFRADFDPLGVDGAGTCGDGLQPGLAFVVAGLGKHDGRRGVDRPFFPPDPMTRCGVDARFASADAGFFFCDGRGIREGASLLRVVAVAAFVLRASKSAFSFSRKTWMSSFTRSCWASCSRCSVD